MSNVILNPNDELEYDAAPEIYECFKEALGISWDAKNFWHRIAITDRGAGVIHVYWDEVLVFVEMEDRFPSVMNITKFRLVSL